MEKVNRDFYGKDILTYCDIPYKSTNCGKYQGFNHNRFYEWALKQDNIYISEYEMPEGFKEVANIEKSVLSAANGNNKKAVEKIFTNERTFNKLSADAKERISFNLSTQMNIFDYMNKCQSCHTNIQECDKCIGYDHYNPNKDRLRKNRKEITRSINESEGEDE